MNVCSRWRLRHDLECRAWTSPPLTIRYPRISMLLPEGPGIDMGVDYFRPLSATAQGDCCILLVTDHFSLRAGMFAATAAEVTAKGTTNIPVK